MSQNPTQFKLSLDFLPSSKMPMENGKCLLLTSRMFPFKRTRTYAQNPKVQNNNNHQITKIVSLTNDSPESTKDNGKPDKCPVPFVIVVNGRDAEKHKDDGLGRARQHLHGVLERGL